MSDCCTYFLFEIQKNGQWISTGIVSKSMNEVLGQSNVWMSQNGYFTNRIIQRKIEEDRKKLRSVPRCC